MKTGVEYLLTEHVTARGIIRKKHRTIAGSQVRPLYCVILGRHYGCVYIIV